MTEDKPHALTTELLEQLKADLKKQKPITVEEWRELEKIHREAHGFNADGSRMNKEEFLKTRKYL